MKQLEGAMRSFCLIALIVSGVMIVVADLASGVEDPSASGADLAEHMNVTEVQRTASDVWKPQEERAFDIESLIAKLMKLLKSVKTKFASFYTSLFQSSTTKTTGMKHDPDVIARYSQVAPAVDDHRFVPPGEPPIAPGKPPTAPVKPPIAPGKSPVRPRKDVTKLVDKLHEDERFKKMWTEVLKRKELKKMADDFRKFSEDGKSESEAAQVVHKKVQEQLSKQDHNYWDGLQEVEYTWWIFNRKDPKDVEAMVKKGGGKDVDAIAKAIADDYKTFLLNIWSHLGH